MNNEVQHRVFDGGLHMFPGDTIRLINILFDNYICRILLNLLFSMEESMFEPVQGFRLISTLFVFPHGVPSLSCFY